jgi:transcriptional regulator of NAD metabolism
MMNTEERRQAIKELLIAGNRPIKGTTLANHFSVSRQVIVQDIALLRAQGLDIMATPQGYVVTKEKNRGIIKSIVAKHHDYQDMEEELQIMLEHGARIMDVVVEHPIYGEIRV